MIVRKLRLEKGWSQEHLAQASGLSTRTVQRIERGQKAGLESLKCLAAVFEIDVAILMQEHTMTDKISTGRTDTAPEKRKAIEYGENIKAFRMSLAAFIIILPALYLLNINLTPEYHWVKWVALFWGVSFVLHGMVIKILYGRFDLIWNQGQLDKRLNRQG